MTAPLVIRLEGAPVAWSRGTPWKGRVLTPAKMRAYQKALRVAAFDAIRKFKEPQIREQWLGALSPIGAIAPHTGPIAITVLAEMPIPKSRRKEWIASEGLMPHIIRCDLDNIVKQVGDSLNKIIWEDDAQIVRLQATKRYSDTPALTITVSEV